MKISHVSWNICGLVIPLFVAALTVPSLLENLGNEKFGLLALAWGLIGYAGAFDLGLGRALTQMVASMIGERRLTYIPDTLATANLITLFSGLFAGSMIALFAVLGGASVLQTQNTSESEVMIAILLLSVALPAQAMSSTYKGLNEAFMNFKGISLLRAFLGIIHFIGPYAVSSFTTQLPWLVSTLVLSRLVSLVIYRFLALRCLRRENETKETGRYSFDIANKLFLFGGWVTVSSVLSPLMSQSDRFFIAALISASAVSTYILPYEIVVQSLVFVGAISSVIFPKLSQLIKEKPADWNIYFRSWLKFVTVLMGTICLLLAFCLPWLLGHWLGDKLNPQSITIGRILCLGVFASSIGAMYYAVIHAKGRADITAKLHIIQVPFYIALLFMLILNFGVFGAAIAWSIRTIADAFALAYFAHIKILN